MSSAARLLYGGKGSLRMVIGSQTNMKSVTSRDILKSHERIISRRKEKITSSDWLEIEKSALIPLTPDYIVYNILLSRISRGLIKKASQKWKRGKIFFFFRNWIIIKRTTTQ